MNPKWTAKAVGLMHTMKITSASLAKEMGVTPEYVSMLLNGHKTPKNAEENVMAAIHRLIEKKAVE